MRDTIRQTLLDAGLDPAETTALVDRALDEDLRDGPDVTTEATVPRGAVLRTGFVSREHGVLAGVPLALAVLDRVVGDRAEIEHAAADGSALEPGTVALALRAPAHELLTAERTALNLMTYASGIATATSRWVAAVAGTHARIRDTRKTLPGLRFVAKYAVRCGGGVNHRMSLGDAALVKDNHIAAAGSVTAAVRAVRERAPEVPLEVEVDTLDQLDEAVAAGAGLVLLDNFTLADTAEAVRRVAGAGVRLEASGGLTLDRARAVAETGVDYLAVGALTHSAPILDLGLDVL